MAGSTPRLDLYLPGGGSDLITPDEPVDIGKINGNFLLVDAAVGAKNVTSGSRPVAPYDGQIAYESDTKHTIVYSSAISDWIVIADGNVTYPLVKPASVTGGTIGALGGVTFNTVPKVSLDGIYSSAFDAYLHILRINSFSVSTNINMNFRSGSPAADDVTTNYHYTTGGAAAAVGPITLQSTQGRVFTELYVSGPNVADLTLWKADSTVTLTATTNPADDRVKGHINTSTQYTGVSFSAGGGNISGTLDTYGLKKGR